jgi:hypothetical protein
LDNQPVAGKAETGEFMRSTMLDMASRLRVATAVEKDETQASRSVFEILQRRGHPDGPPPTISDGWGGIDEAMLAIYGLTPEYSGRGRSPTRKKPGKDWLYLQMVKQRDEHGHFTGTKLKAIFGNQQELLQLLGGSTLGRRLLQPGKTSQGFTFASWRHSWSQVDTANTHDGGRSSGACLYY